MVDEDVDEEADIANCTGGIVFKMENDEDLDAAIYSSSFENTFSGSDNSQPNQDHGDMVTLFSFKC